ncbi:pentatricopeptide repeat-containing protein At1g62350-like [Mercurialis annua]|uniref:pentatricopeptide repeat-containing protein At1g62350-like n=1 Tax=Mercurialis annua TaxID=3986 RepID=UPI00215F09D5|nr:pentatricopeptide repeat-containing protein At1g62350-like [Mercurialis annua]
MESTSKMASTSLKFQFPPHLKLFQIPQKLKNPTSIITCSLRGKPRKPLWRSKRLSSEAIQAVQSLKLAKSSNSRLQNVFENKLSRLLKTDLIDTLELLQDQNELDLALKVFDYVQKEIWYKPDITLYYGILEMLGKNEMILMAEGYFCKLEEEGLKHDTRTFSEMIGAYLKVGMVEKAMEMYGRLKESGCVPDKLTFAILIRNLEDAGRSELVDVVKKDCDEYMDYPEKFLEEIERKMDARGPSINLV